MWLVDTAPAPASVAPPISIWPPSSALSRVISVIASPVTRRVFQPTLSIVEENTTFGVSRQLRANSISAEEACHRAEREESRQPESSGVSR